MLPLSRSMWHFMQQRTCAILNALFTLGVEVCALKIRYGYSTLCLYVLSNQVDFIIQVLLRYALPFIGSSLLCNKSVRYKYISVQVMATEILMFMCASLVFIALGWHIRYICYKYMASNIRVITYHSISFYLSNQGHTTGTFYFTSQGNIITALIKMVRCIQVSTLANYV